MLHSLTKCTPPISNTIWSSTRLLVRSSYRHRSTACQRFLSLSSICTVHRRLTSLHRHRELILPSSRGLWTMGPVTPVDVKSAADQLIKENAVVIFSKSYCPFCTKVKGIFNELGAAVHVIELDHAGNGDDIQAYLLQLTGQKTVPNVFINQTHIGGASDTEAIWKNGSLAAMLDTKKYDYDLFVIGGGSGGLSCSKESASLGKRVAVADFVQPTPLGATWGLGGTCVNVGCIPKKLMHQAALLGEAVSDAKEFGWSVPDKVTHDWSKLTEGIQDHIGSLNWGYKVSLRDAGVKYLNSLAKLTDANTVHLTTKSGKVETVSARHVVLAMGGRPTYPDIPGAREHCITSDDIFSLSYNPGKTLFIGASYIALECAGFLHGLGNDVSVMVRSIFLRGFDQEMANKIADYMAEPEGKGVKFLKKCVPVKIERTVERSEETPAGELAVTFKDSEGNEQVMTVNTVCLAIGRHPLTDNIGLREAGVELDKKGKVVVDDLDCSNVPNIHAIGDIASEKLELTPVAIQAGKLLARRLFAGEQLKCDYVNVPTTVFTPLEYGSCGLSEEDALEKFGEENIEVFHSSYTPLEQTVPHRPENKSFAKIIANKADENRVLGFHVLGPNAGEMTQGFAIALKLRATKQDFDNLIGIHPTNAEQLTTLTVTKSSGKSALTTGC